jgi:hypothetical protein
LIARRYPYQERLIAKARTRSAKYDLFGASAIIFQEIYRDTINPQFFLKT